MKRNRSLEPGDMTGRKGRFFIRTRAHLFTGDKIHDAGKNKDQPEGDVYNGGSCAGTGGYFIDRVFYKLPESARAGC